MTILAVNQESGVFVGIEPMPLDIEAQIRAINNSGADIGAIAQFIGYVRGYEQVCDSCEPNSEKELTGLLIEHYEAMTSASIKKICWQAIDRWPVKQCRVVHRVGLVKAAEPIVIVLVASQHRKAAFSACEYIMDFLKTSAPFWKKAVFSDGSEEWIQAKESDKNHLNKWLD